MRPGINWARRSGMSRALILAIRRAHDHKLTSLSGLRTMSSIFAFLPNFGVIELVVIAITAGIMLMSLVLPVWGIIDAAQRPDPQWKRLGASRTTWIVLMAVFLFLCAPVSVVISIYYLVSLRPRLASWSLDADG
jgi:hypothetical protein